jgi:CrcB protein
MWNYVSIAVFGVLGCWARYAQTRLIQALWGSDFPYATLSINLMGSFLMGFLFYQSIERFSLPAPLRVGLLTGLLGGYTTFSTFQMETLLLIEDGGLGKALLYDGLSLGLGLVCVYLGSYLARLL